MEISDGVSCNPLHTSGAVVNEGLPKPSTTAAQRLRTPVFAERLCLELSNDGIVRRNTVVSHPTPQLLSAPASRTVNGRPCCLRFSMDFMYPKNVSHEGKACEISQLDCKAFPSCSPAFDDNFDSIDLTQMLEKTAVDAASDEVSRESLQQCTGERFSTSERDAQLSKDSLYGGGVSKFVHGFETSAGSILSLSSHESSSQSGNCDSIRGHSLGHNGGSPSQVLKGREPTLKAGSGEGTLLNFSCGFKTAAGAPLNAPSFESLSRAKLLLEECTGQAENSSADVEDFSSNISKYCDQSSRIILPEAAYCNSRYEFRTASGTALKTPSFESLSRAKRVFEEFADRIDDSGNHSGCVFNIRPSYAMSALGSNKISKHRVPRSHIKSLASSQCQPDLADFDRPLKSHPETANHGEFTIEAFVKHTIDSIKFSRKSNKLGNIGENDSFLESPSSGAVSKSTFSIGSLNRTEDKLKDNQAVHILHGKTGNYNPPKTGFVTGRGVPFTLSSDESMKRARRLLEDCFKDNNGNKPTDDGMRCDFPAPCGSTPRYDCLLAESSEKTETEGCNMDRNVVRYSRVNGGSSVTHETTFFVRSHENSLGKLAFAAGNFPISTSDVSLRQATAIFSKCAPDFESQPNPQKIESKSLGVGESPKFVSSTTEVDGEMSPTLDFDGSFEISSQIMNVVEGNLSQSSDTVELSEVEGQRVEARSVQEAEADRHFKLSTTPHLKFKSWPVGSLSAHSTTHKIAQEPAAPGTLWQLRKCGGRVVAKDLPSYPVSYSTEKGLHFAGDFLRLDDASSFSINSASNLKFKLDSGSVNVSYRLGDGVEVIPDSLGYAGCAEIVRAFVCSPGVNKGLVSRRWIAHHYSQIAWRFGCVALIHYRNLVDKVFPHLSLPDSAIQRTDGRLLLHALLLELKYRYDRELEAVERSPIRKIMERDDIPAKRIVLCVSHLESLSNHRYRGRLTDGWYHVDWAPDCMLTRVIERGQIKVGTKLVTAGAELIQTPSGSGSSCNNGNDARDDRSNDEDTHLFGNTSNGLSLRLNGNSTRLAPPSARLGFAHRSPVAHLPPIPLSTISPDGGPVSCICVLIQRRFQLQYMETCSSHADSNEGERVRRYHVFRDPRSEQAAERLHSEKCQLALDQAINEFNSPRGKSGRRVQPQPSFLASLGLDGEALWDAVNNAFDPDLAESNLSAAQLDAMFRYKEVAVQNILAQSSSKREVTQLLRLQVAGIHPLDIEKHMELPLTLWNPTEEMLNILSEGSVVQLTRLQVSTMRPSDPFATLPSCASDVGQVLSLSGGRATTVRLLKAAEVIKFFKRGQPTTSTSVQNRINMVYRPRSFLSVGSLKKLASTSFDRPIVVDFTALVVGAKTISTLNSSRPNHTGERSELSVVYLASIRNEGSEEDFSTLAVLRVWGGLERYSLNSVLAARNRVRFTDVQLRDCGKLPIHSDFPPEGNSEVFYVLLNYSTASYVTSEKLPQDSTVRRFRTPWKETPQFYSYMEACMESHFEKFFSGRTSSLLATPNPKISTSVPSSSTSILQQTPKLKSIPVLIPCSLSNCPKGRGGLSSSPLKSKTRNAFTKSPSVFSASKSRTRTGLYRPKRALPAVTMALTSTSSSGCDVLSPFGPSQHAPLRELLSSSCSPPERSLRPSCSTPLPVKRSCSLMGNFEIRSEFLETTAISLSPDRHSSATRSRSPLFPSSSPKQESESLTQLKSPKSPQFNFPMSPPCLSSDSVDPDSLISVEAKVCNLNKSPPLQSSLESSSTSQPGTLKSSISVEQTNAAPSVQLNMPSEDSASLDVSIADLVKTRKRGRNSSSQNTSSAPKKRSLNLKSTP